MKCDSCQMLSINGVPCHETGCPNTNARYDADSDTWIKQRKCFECGCTVDADDPCCNAPYDEDEDEDECSEIWHYLSIRYNVNKNGLVTQWQLVNHGREHEQYFQGCGVSFTPFDHVSTGIGDDATEALEDALEQMATMSHTVSKAAEKRMQREIA